MNKPFVSLKVAAEAKVPGINKETNFQVAPHLVKVEPGFNRPISRENVEQFKTSIRNGATIPPIFVRVVAGEIIMVDGEHRLIAVNELVAEGVEIPSMAATQFRGNDADRVAHLLTSSQGMPLTPLEAGIQYLKLVRFGWTNKQIADRVGRSLGHISQCLGLAGANTDVQLAIKNGEVSSTTAMKVVRTHGEGAGAIIKDAVVRGGGRATEKAVAGSKPSRKLLEELCKAVAAWDQDQDHAKLRAALDVFNNSF